jgi:serine/threonine-protein kinase RsbW
VILQLQATPEEVMRAVGALQEFARHLNLGEKDIFGLALSLEECGSNIVDHAYHRDARQRFQVSFEAEGNTLMIELRDHGPEFDPTRAPVRPPAGDEEDRPPGGWGLQLVRHYMDEIQYRREPGENVLRLIKTFTKPGENTVSST